MKKFKIIDNSIGGHIIEIFDTIQEAQNFLKTEESKCNKLFEDFDMHILEREY